jgi:hypothetical protein
MGALIVILPVFAFDLWLLLTTGRKQCRRWAGERKQSNIVKALLIGLALGLWLAFIVNYRWDSLTRARGFPIPWANSSLDHDHWSDYTPTPIAALQYLGIAANFLTGFAAVVMPFKIAEFLQSVKTELNR